MRELLDRVTQGDRRALARAITHIENQGSIGRDLIDMLEFNHSQSHIIGITGPPGSGKSTLVDQMIKSYREQDLTVGVLAVDPTSPFTGGAILGDRIRMLSTTADSGVYIRSLASRGRLGGLSPHTFDVLRVMQTAGFDKIIVETVGAGQSEVDIVKNADTTVVLTVPGLGDDIQVIKAGIMEIADIFVINKSDLSGASGLALQIRNMLGLIPNTRTWDPTVVQTSAINSTGITDFVSLVVEHYEFLIRSGDLESQRRQHLRFDLTNKFQTELITLLNGNDDPLSQVIDQLLAGEMVISSALKYLQEKLFTTKSNI